MNREERLSRLKKYLPKVASSEKSLESLIREPAGATEGLEAAGPPADEALERGYEALEKFAHREDPTDAELDALEAIVLPRERPVVLVRNDSYGSLPEPWEHFTSPDIRRRLEEAIPSIGRVELPGHVSIPYGGTAFVVGEGVLMTNRHVAQLFATGLGLSRLAFLAGQTAGCDFKREKGSDEADFVEVRQILMIHPWWDMALLKVDGLAERRKPLRISVRHPDELDGREVAVIGYPARDWRNDSEVQDRVFERTYNVKRLQPGKLHERERVRSFGNDVLAITHDSSTLGGNSGSAVIDVGTGEVVALHFAGVYLKDNYAVPAHELSRDVRVRDAGLNFAGPLPPTTNEWEAAWRRAHEELAGGPAPRAGSVPALGSAVASNRLPPASAPPPPAGAAQPVLAAVMTFAVRTPMQFSISLDGPLGALPATAPAPGEAGAVEAPALRIEPDPDYDNRRGYDPFSNVMNRRRRLAYYTAVNIDGKREKDFSRDDFDDKWFLDPRIGEDEQLQDDLYAANRFDRGHLVRRLDPVWGRIREAKKAHDDTFHWTNCSPQHERFNRNKSTWGRVEERILRNAQARNQRVSVFTGPVFRPGDGTFTTRSGDEVQIPSEFWKVVAMLDDQGKLTATAYLLTQAELISDMVEALVEPKSFQVNVRRIEELTGLSFHRLRDHDPFVDAGETTGRFGKELSSVDDIVLS